MTTYGGYTDGTSATPAVGFMTTIKNLLTGAGWVFVETTTATTYTADVFKNAAAHNSFGKDFYLATVRSSDNATSLYCRVFEGYDAVNHRMQGFNPSGYQTLTPAANTYLNPNADATPAASYSGPAISVVVGWSCYYLISVTADRLMVATRTSGGQYSLYAGLYDSFIPNDPFPLMVLDTGQVYSSQGTGGYGSATREPGQAASSQYNFYVQGCSTYDCLVYFAGSALDIYRNAFYAGPLMFRTSRNTSNVRGYLKGVVAVPGLVGGFTMTSAQILGDQCLLDGSLYVRIGYNSLVSAPG